MATPHEYNSPKRLLTVKEIAALFSVSERTVYRWVRKRIIPAYKLPSGLRFKNEDTELFLEKIRAGSIDEYMI